MVRKLAGLHKRSEERKTSIKLTSLAVILGLANCILIIATVFNLPLSWVIILFLSIFMIGQAVTTIIWMVYAWNDPKTLARNRSPKVYLKPNLTFSAIIPARHEEQVIADTLLSVASIDYPSELHEVIVVCREDDTKTIQAIKDTVHDMELSNVRLAIFKDKPINKPHALNFGLTRAKGEVVVVFDAEDEPHRDIYSIVNTIMLKERVNAVQAGVQLMNFRSNWYSALNVLEYFFWFRSTLQFFSNLSFIPLAGNTVFVKRAWLRAIGGWDETCLTEDADLGIRLSTAGVKMRVFYDEKHVTQEETPPTLESFIKQRTRWNLGFLQIFLKGEWLFLPKLSQRILAAYLLILPNILAGMFLYMPISVLMMVAYKLPVGIAMISAIPLYLFLLILVICSVGLYEFTKAYKLEFPLFAPILIVVTFYPYGVILCLSAFRAIFRLITQNLSWEKTLHVNAHRTPARPQVSVFAALKQA